MPETAFELGGTTVEPGERKIVNLPLGFLSDHTRTYMTIEVIRGRKPGPATFVSAAIHGDEIIGVEIVRRLSGLSQLNRIRGTLILVPIVNIYGFLAMSRYLPDRRDLNRSFPGNETGSLAAQLAHIFMTEIVSRSAFGIDLHSAAIHRDNLPQVRGDLDNPVVAGMARAFGAPIMLNAEIRDGSLRESAGDIGCQSILYEAGEALRFDEAAVRIGVKGIINVLRHIGNLPEVKAVRPKPEPIRALASHWLRAPMGGILRAEKRLGQFVVKDEILARVSDPFGRHTTDLVVQKSGIIIGRSNLPIVNRGDAAFHIATVDSLDQAEEAMTAIEHEAQNDPLFHNTNIV